MTFAKKINKIDEPLARLTKQKKTLVNRIRNETGEIITVGIRIENHRRLLSQ